MVLALPNSLQIRLILSFHTGSSGSRRPPGAASGQASLKIMETGQPTIMAGAYVPIAASGNGLEQSFSGDVGYRHWTYATHL